MSRRESEKAAAAALNEVKGLGRGRSSLVTLGTGKIPPRGARRQTRAGMTNGRLCT
jgi:hypothetical protein